MLLCFSTQFLKAQNFEDVLLASINDANKLIQAYITPAVKGLISGMNNGWYHTAKVHKKLEFDISIRADASIMPTKDEIFSFADLSLTNVIVTPSLTTPTIVGLGDGAMVDASADVNINGTMKTINISFEMPSGIKDDLPLNAIPSAAVQLTLGLPLNLDVMLRFIPEVGSEDVKGKLLGLGLKKEITRLFGPLDKFPLHVSLLVAYATMDVTAYTIMDVNHKINNITLSGRHQLAEFKLNSFTTQAIASFNFPIINIYGGLGYSGGNSTLKTRGTYDVVYNTGLPAPDETITEIISDPIDLDFDASSFKATLGVKLSLGFFKIFGDYTLQEYNTLSAGIAFGFREQKTNKKTM